MGRHLAAGVACKIKVVKSRNSTYDINENKEELIEQISKKIPLENYDFDEFDGKLIFTIKKEFFEKNVDKFIEEMNSILAYNAFIEEYKGPFKIVKTKNVEEKAVDVKVTTSEAYNNIYVDSDPWDYCTWVLDEKMRKQVRVIIECATFWMDVEKISIEDEYSLLHILNTLCRQDNQHPLLRYSNFYIIG